VAYGTDEVPPLAQRPVAETLAALNASIPPQSRFVSVLVTGQAAPKQPGQAAVPAELGDVLGAVQTIASAAGVTVRVEQTQRAALHPGRAGAVLVGDVEVGYLGEVLPAVSADADLPGRVYVAELDLDALTDLAGERVTAASLSTFPAATQDVSLIVPAALPAADLAAALREGAGDLLESLRLVDDYRGTGVPDDAKSLTFALRFRAPDRTLTAAEATEAKLGGVGVATARFGATLRE
jgi:phenylalanyl-tRNA synthetase beta chain